MKIEQGYKISYNFNNLEFIEVKNECILPPQGINSTQEKLITVATAVNLELTLNNHHTTLPRKKIRFFTTHFYRGKS